MAFMDRNMGHTFHKYILSIFSVMAGWIANILFYAVLCLYCCVTDRTYSEV